MPDYSAMVSAQERGVSVEVRSVQSNLQNGEATPTTEA
jgi:hypothetical protein